MRNLTPEEIKDIIQAVETQAQTFQWREERTGEGYDGDVAKRLYVLVAKIKEQAA